MVYFGSCDLLSLCFIKCVCLIFGFAADASPSSLSLQVSHRYEISIAFRKMFYYATLASKSKLNDAIFGANNTNISVDDYSLYIGMRVTLDSKVNFTNGKVSKDGKTVSWVIKDSNKVTRLCASTTKVTRTARSNSVVNGKTYKAGKKLTVANPKSLAKMKLDGTAVKPGKAVTKKGTHKLIIWSKDGKVQRVTFKIK